jgi:hypothetical protein
LVCVAARSVGAALRVCTRLTEREDQKNDGQKINRFHDSPLIGGACNFAQSYLDKNKPIVKSLPEVRGKPALSSSDGIPADKVPAPNTHCGFCVAGCAGWVELVWDGTPADVSFLGGISVPFG